MPVRQGPADHTKRYILRSLCSINKLTAWSQRIEHAGYQRYILQRNPPRYDPDGDIVEAGDEYEDEDELSTVEENPYADIQLESTSNELLLTPSLLTIVRRSACSFNFRRPAANPPLV